MARTNRNLFLSLIAFAFIGCSDDCRFLVSDKLSDSLFVEKYCTSRGSTYANGTYPTFITDSATFRFEVGSVGDHDNISAKLEGDTVVVQVLEPDDTKVKDKEETFLLDELKAKYNYKQPDELRTPLTGERLIGENSRANFPFTQKIDPGLYSEEIQYTFNTNDSTKKQKFINAIYITDSLTFRLFAYNYDMDRWTNGSDQYDLNIQNKKLKIVKYHIINNFKVIEEMKWDLRIIKASGKYDPVCPNSKLY